MRVFGLPWSFHPLAKYPPLDLAPQARDRLRALQLWADTGDVALVGRTFTISRATLYRWRAQFDPAQPQSLTARSRRPHHVRHPQWPLGLVTAVRRLRRTYPRWGKDKLVVLLRHERWQVSTSTVGRILTHLRTQGQLVEPPRRPVSARKRRRVRAYAIRKPREYQPTQPGDLVELDTLDVRPVPGITLKHFTARDVISRWDVLQARSAPPPPPPPTSSSSCAPACRSPSGPVRSTAGPSSSPTLKRPANVPASAYSSCRPRAPSSTVPSNGRNARIQKSFTN
jgi:Homeodomain-like domain